ncbi:MAG: hypothetical protein JO086_00190 [Acidimicrobiia bacterium]|nr:hypothetical protein [Acidimicrobiia bacterium]
MARTKRTIPVELNVTTPDAGDGEEGAHESVRSSPFFANAGDVEEILDHIVISREKPIREGQLGTLPPDASEEDIREIYGGGTFRLIGRTERKKPIKGAFTTVDLAGDPIFTNDMSRRRWETIKRQQLGEEPKAPLERPVADDAAADAKHRRELERIRAEIEAKEAIDERRRARERADREAERIRLAEERKAEREERDAAEERRREREREERRAEAAERAAAEERRWREQREADDRRWKTELDERRLEREQRQDPTELMLKGIQIAMSLGGGGGGPEDPVAAFVNKGPEILAGLKDLAITAGAGGARPKANPAPRAAASEKIEIEGPLADQVRRVAASLQRAGKNPEQAISQAMAKALAEVAPKKAAGALPPKAPTAATPRARAARRPPVGKRLRKGGA